VAGLGRGNTGLNEGAERTKYWLRRLDGPHVPPDPPKGCPYKAPSMNTCPASAGFSFWSAAREWP